MREDNEFTPTDMARFTAQHVIDGECGSMSAWDSRFLSLAGLVGSWSKDLSTKVGAVIVDRKKRVISLGFNGFPTGVDDTPVERERKLLRTIHAEENALLFAQRDVEGCTIYVTHHPCARCSAKIVQAGVGRVVIANHMHEKWRDECTEAAQLLKEAGIEVRYPEAPTP